MPLRRSLLSFVSLLVLAPVSALYALVVPLALNGRLAPVLTPALLAAGIALASLWVLQVVYLRGGAPGLRRAGAFWWWGAAVGVVLVGLSIALPLLGSSGVRVLEPALTEPLPALWLGTPALLPLGLLWWERRRGE